MKQIILLTLIFFSSVNVSIAQIHVNSGVDTSSQQVQSAISFMESYLKDFKDDKKVDFAEYYSDESLKKYEKPDKIAYSLIGDNPVYIMGQPTLLSTKENNDTIRLKLQFAQCDSSGNISTNFISNHIISINQAKARFLVNLDVNTSSWNETQIRNIRYHYPKYHSFDSSLAYNIIDQVKKLEKDWNLSPEEIDYYFAKTNQEIQKIRGFDFNFYMGGNEVPTGLADVRDNLVFTSGLNEGNFHEIVHIYLNKKYPESPLKEGIAVYYGGSLGYNLKWHLNKLNAFIKENPELEIADPQSFYYLDNETNPQYAIQGLLCHLAYEKGGIEGLKKLMNYKDMEQVYTDYFNVEEENLNEFLKEEINKYCR